MEDPQDSLKSQPILHNNYRRADWASYTDFTESAFSALPPPSSCSIGEKTFRNILRVASVRFIPRGSIPNYTPHLSDAAKRLTSERDRLRATDPQNPEIAILNNRISDELDSSARSAWTERVMAATPKDNSTKFYSLSLLRSLSGKNTAVAPNQPIMLNNGSLSNTTSIARAFCKQFTGCSPRRTRASRWLRRLIKRRPLDHSLLLFTPVQVHEAIMASGNSTAHGPDHLNILHLKHLGPTGISYLCSLFNLYLASADIPSIWKQAIIIALLKAGKPASLGTSYRPISLLSPTAKVLERLLLPILNEHLHTDIANTTWLQAEAVHHYCPTSDCPLHILGL